MKSTVFTIAAILSILIISSLALGLHISKSNARVLALSIVHETGYVEFGKDTLYYRSTSKSKLVDARTKKAIRYLGRGYKAIKIEN